MHIPEFNFILFRTKVTQRCSSLVFTSILIELSLKLPAKCDYYQRFPAYNRITSIFNGETYSARVGGRKDEIL
jgi:hypothetical protein